MFLSDCCRVDMVFTDWLGIFTELICSKWHQRILQCGASSIMCGYTGTVTLLHSSIMERGTNIPQYLLLLLLSHILIRLYKARGVLAGRGHFKKYLAVILSPKLKIFINVNKYSKMIIIFIFIIAFTSLPSSKTEIKIIYS